MACSVVNFAVPYFTSLKAQKDRISISIRSEPLQWVEMTGYFDAPPLYLQVIYLEEVKGHFFLQEIITHCTVLVWGTVDSETLLFKE